MIEYIKITEVTYSSAVKTDGIYQSPLAGFSLNSPLEKPSEEKQEMLRQERDCGRTSHALGASVPGWQCHILHLSHFYLGFSVESLLVKHHAAHTHPWAGTLVSGYCDRELLSSMSQCLVPFQCGLQHDLHEHPSRPAPPVSGRAGNSACSQRRFQVPGCCGMLCHPGFLSFIDDSQEPPFS